MNRIQVKLGINVLMVVAVLVAAAAPAIASSPELAIVTPRGLQQGAAKQFNFHGKRLADVKEVIFYTDGFKAESIEVVKPEHVKVTITAPADCRIGEHMVQLRCASGVSDFRSIWVGALPEVKEVEPNTTFDQPQAIDLNVTVEGNITSEDVDYFVIDAKKGQRITAEVEAMRLGTFMFDPYVAILDKDRFELDAEDDAPLLKQDSLASIIAPEDGRYFIQIRETSYGGHPNCYYRLHVGTFPRPTAVFPAGGKRGEEIDVRYIGDIAGEITAKVKVPDSIRMEHGVIAADAQGQAPSWNPFRVYDHGNAFEQEPNDNLNEATAAELPNAFNGIIEKPGDIDCFKFNAKKGQKFDLECYARRIRSGLDPTFYIYNSENKYLGGNDDSRGGPDSYFQFEIPEDGEYKVRVTDHLSRGQADFVYRIEINPVKPKLQVTIPPVARYSQQRQSIFVARGNRFATLINATKQNFGGPIDLTAEGLPQGVTMVSETMTPNIAQTAVVFEAAADAPVGGKLIRLHGKHKDNPEIAGEYYNKVYFIRGNNAEMFIGGVVDRLPVVVVDELPYTLEVVQPKVPLIRNGTMQVKVIAHRKEGFEEPIHLQWPFRPPGIGVTQSVKIEKGKTECLYSINANGNAPIQKWPFYVLGWANVGGQAWVSSQMAHIEVAEPFVNVETKRASVEQGQETQLVCKLAVAKPFDGEANLQVFGLPDKVTTEVSKFNKDAKELIFNVKTDAASPAGKHKGVFCRVTITQNGEPITGNTGWTELQIDKPLPAPAKPAPKPAAAAQPKPEQTAQAKPAPKPLSRLEKLRLEAKSK